MTRFWGSGMDTPNERRPNDRGNNTRPPRLSVGRLLTLLLPGLGHLYFGRPRAALTLTSCFLVGGVGFFAACLAPGVVYLRPAGLFVLYYFVLVFTAWLNLGSIYQNDGFLGNGSRRGPLFLVACWFAFFVVPVSLASYVAHRLWGSLAVADYGYYPQVVPGDHVLFRRGIELPPNRGELVVVAGINDTPVLGRVVALPGEVIWIESDGGLVVDDAPIGKRALGRIEVVDPALDVPFLANLRAFRETNMAVPFEGVADERATMRPTDPWVIPDGHYFVVSDNRTAEDAVDSRSFGVVSEHKIIGMPLYISWSTEPGSHTVRWRRLGLALR